MKKSTITKEQIIKSAAKAIAKKGLENVTVDDIAIEAKIAKGSIYRYFKSRDDILIEGIQFAANQRISALQKLLEKYPTATSKIRALLKASRLMAKNEPDIFLMNYSLLLSTHKHIKRKGASAYFTAFLDLVEEIIESGIKNKEFRKGDARTIALAVILTQDFGSIFDFLDPKIIDKHGMQKNILKLIKNS